MKVSIVIPSWFTRTQHGKYGKHETYWFATKCLRRLLDVTPRDLFELIIIDNGSTITASDCHERNAESEDASLKVDALPQQYFESADILIKNPTNLGFAKSCNQGFAKATGDYICCLNNDILVWEGWLESILETFKLINDDYKTGMVAIKPAGVIMPALIHETRDAVEAIKLSKNQINMTRNSDKFGEGAEFGSLWVAPRELLQKIASRRDGYQVFDENFKLGMGEDRWLWQEVRMEGFQTYRTHKTRVFHQGNMTIGKVKDRKVYTSKNREYLSELKKKHNICEN